MWFDNSTNLSAGHGPVTRFVTDPQAITTNTWVHYAVTWDNDTRTMVLYRNGSNVSACNLAPSWSGSTGQLGIGKYSGGDIFNGYLDDVRVFNRCLTAEHVQTIFTAVNPLLLINRVTSATPVAAYSLKLVNSSYSNPVVQLRRSSDNNTLDFYSTSNGTLTTGAAATGTSYFTWIGANTAFVVTWYDQTGRGKHVTQATQTLQPPLVNDGASGFCVYTASNRFLSGPNVFDITSTNNMHLIMTSKEITRLHSVLISLHGQNVGEPRFFIHGPFTNGIWYWAPLNFGDNRAFSSSSTAVGERIVFSGYKDPVTIKNGFRLNSGQSNVSTTNTSAPVSGGIVFNVTSGGYSNNHYIYDAYVFNGRLSASDESYMESNCAFQLPVNQVTSASPVALYGMKLMNSNFTSPVIQLRRSSDNNILDFHSTSNGILSTGAGGTGTLYTSWIGANTAHVVTWYDQSGRGKHVSQATQANQPTIVNDGAAGFAVYVSANRSLTGGNIFDTNSVSNMHLVVALKEKGRADNAVISFNGGNINIPRFSLHAPWTDNNWFWDAGDFSGNRANGGNLTPSINTRVVFSGYKSTASSNNGFRLNRGTLITSSQNTATSVTGGIRLNINTSGWVSNHYIYNVAIFNNRLSTADEIIMESFV
jgi:hypothetical protein